MNMKLEQAVEAARQLPDDVQQVLADELMADVASYQGSNLSDAQRAIVIERLARPLDLVETAEIEATLHRFQHGA